MASYDRSTEAANDLAIERAAPNLGKSEFMAVEDCRTLDQLGRIVSRIRSDPTLRSDLMQEGLIHLWQIQEEKPGQTRSWYLQNCHFHLLHYLGEGRSVDSLKRRNLQVQADAGNDEEDGLWDSIAGPDAGMAEVSARDMLCALGKELSERERMILHHLAEGLGVREISRQLDVSHPAVIKSRRKIAGIAKKLAILPLSDRAPMTSTIFS
jgi:RNA polymerase sigma factor (sigma-70 family)